MMTTDPDRRFGLVDLFCGCGGLSLGFSLTGRFESLLGCDIKPEATAAFALNHGRLGENPTTVTDDIKDLDPARVEGMVDAAGLRGRRLCLVGGPPCEGFSQNRSEGSGGDWREAKAKRVDKFVDDPRNQLFRWYLGIAAHLKPSVLLIENVPDLVRHREGETLREIFAELASLGYRAEAKILNAADFGVPQIRRRTFILAQRWDDVRATGIKLHFPVATHTNFPYSLGNEARLENWLPGDSGYWVTFDEAVGDLPSACDSSNDTWAGYPEGPPLSMFRRWVRAPGGAQVTHHIGRKLEGTSYQRVVALSSGQKASDLPDDVRPRSSFHYSYSRLRWNEPARTVTKFVYNVGSGMFAHPELDRAITMREAARLQSFPDWFVFPTTRIREVSALIGSAVPPLLAWHIGVQVARYIDQLDRHDMVQAGLTPGVGVASDAVMRRLEGQTWTNDDQAAVAESPAPAARKGRAKPTSQAVPEVVPDEGPQQKMNW